MKLSFPYKFSFFGASCFSEAARKVRCLFELLAFYVEKLPKSSNKQAHIHLDITQKLSSFRGGANHGWT